MMDLFSKQNSSEWFIDMFKNAGRSILKASQLWKFTIVMAAAHNCVYGSALSPGRIFQIREALANRIYFTKVLKIPNPPDP